MKYFFGAFLLKQLVINFYGYEFSDSLNIDPTDDWAEQTGFVTIKRTDEEITAVCVFD